VVPAIYFTPLSKTIIEFIILQSLDRVTTYNFLLVNTSIIGCNYAAGAAVAAVLGLYFSKTPRSPIIKP